MQWEPEYVEINSFSSINIGAHILSLRKSVVAFIYFTPVAWVRYPQPSPPSLAEVSVAPFLLSSKCGIGVRVCRELECGGIGVRVWWNWRLVA